MSAQTTPTGPAGDQHFTIDSDAISALVDHWVSEEFVTEEQARSMRADLEAIAPAPPAPHLKVASIVVEALGYLGAVIIVVALGLVVSRFWGDIPTVARVSAGILIAAALVLAGNWVPAADSDSADRLRSVLWALACVVLGGTASILAIDVFHLNEAAPLCVAAVVVALAGAVSWWKHPGLLQHAVVFVALAITAVTGTQLVFPPPAEMFREQPAFQDSLPGVTVWVLSAVWFALSQAGLLRPKELGKILGAAGMVLGAMIASEFGWGIALGIVTVVGLVVLAVRLLDFGVLIVGALGTLQVLPMAVTRYFPGTLAAASALLVVGAALVGSAVYIARRRARKSPGHRADARS